MIEQSVQLMIPFSILFSSSNDRSDGLSFYFFFLFFFVAWAFLWNEIENYTILFRSDIEIKNAYFLSSKNIFEFGKHGNELIGWCMELLRLRGVTGWLDNFPIQQKERLFRKAIFLYFILKTTNSNTLQASDFSLIKELHIWRI